jgi:hypothetical protein
MSGRIDADVAVAAVLEAPVVKHSQALALLRRAGTDLQLDQWLAHGAGGVRVPHRAWAAAVRVPTRSRG